MKAQTGGLSVRRRQSRHFQPSLIQGVVRPNCTACVVALGAPFMVVIRTPPAGNLSEHAAAFASVAFAARGSVPHRIPGRPGRWSCLLRRGVG